MTHTGQTLEPLRLGAVYRKELDGRIEWGWLDVGCCARDTPLETSVKEEVEGIERAVDGAGGADHVSTLEILDLFRDRRCGKNAPASRSSADL
jgi:hypothetical protein